MAYSALSLAAKTARSNALIQALGNSALIRLYTGAPPVNVDAAATGTLLSTLTCNSAGFGQAVPGGVNQITVTAGGSGYTSPPAVSFTGGGGSGATAVATVSGGAVTSISITNSGTNFNSSPAVVLTGGAGSGAAAGAAVGVVIDAGAITQDNSAVGTGTPGYARLLTSGGTAVMDVDVSAPGGGGSMQIVPSQLTAGAPVTCSSFVISEG